MEENLQEKLNKINKDKDYKISKEELKEIISELKLDCLNRNKEQVELMCRLQSIPQYYGSYYASQSQSAYDETKYYIGQERAYTEVLSLLEHLE
jgi:hypothetical protein